MLLLIIAFTLTFSALVALFLFISTRHAGGYFMVLDALPADAVAWSLKGWHSSYTDAWGVTWDAFHPWIGAVEYEDADYPEYKCGDLSLDLDEAFVSTEEDKWERAKAVMAKPVVVTGPSLTPTQAFYAHEWN